MHAPPSAAGQPKAQITAPHRGKEGKTPRTRFATAEAGEEKKKKRTESSRSCQRLITTWLRSFSTGSLCSQLHNKPMTLVSCPESKVSEMYIIIKGVKLLLNKHIC